VGTCSILLCFDCRLPSARHASRLREETVLDPEFIRELFAPFRHVAVKRMFGAGLFAEG